MSLSERLTRISPANQHCFFGYYDLPAWNRTGDIHLAHRVPFMDRIPDPEDVAEIGFLRNGDTSFHRIASTTAWNFQQGSMLQWLPNTDYLIFNQRHGEHYRGIIADLDGHTVQQLERPVANVDPLGRFTLSISFPRMMDFRPGYGYAGLPDPNLHQAQPSDDGIFRVELTTGRSELILSLHDLGKLCRDYYKPTDKLLINHLNLNPSGTRFIALLRNFPTQPGTRHKTIAFTAAADGSEPYILWDGGVASHYHWRDDTVVSMVIKDPLGRITLAEFQDQAADYQLVDPDFFLDDGHQSYSPDKQHLLYDSYPIQGRRHLYIYDLAQHQGQDLGSLLSRDLVTPTDNEVRCDLHPRWHHTGSLISLDSIHDGYRGIYTYQL